MQKPLQCIYPPYWITAIHALCIEASCSPDRALRCHAVENQETQRLMGGKHIGDAR